MSSTDQSHGKCISQKVQPRHKEKQTTGNNEQSGKKCINAAWIAMYVKCARLDANAITVIGGGLAAS